MLSFCVIVIIQGFKSLKHNISYSVTRRKKMNKLNVPGSLFKP